MGIIRKFLCQQVIIAIDGTEDKRYVLDDTSFDIAVGETTKISLDSQSTQEDHFPME